MGTGYAVGGYQGPIGEKKGSDYFVSFIHVAREVWFR